MKKLFIIRRIVGGSMLPSLRPGKIVFGWYVRRLAKGDIVILHHEGCEKIKRIRHIDGNRLYIHDDNTAVLPEGTPLNWVERSQILARVIWPRYQSLE